MGWFTKKDAAAAKPESPKEEIWVQCPSCKAHIYREEWEKNAKVCDRCQFHDRLTWEERVNVMFDPGSFKELNAKISFNDPLKFSDAKGSYAEKAAETCQKTGLKESVVTGTGTIKGIKATAAIMDFRFLGGSLASGTGEKILLAALHAVKHHTPYLIVSASGGARMHEGIVSRYPGLDAERAKYQTISAMIGACITDLTATTLRNLATYSIRSAEDLRRVNRQVVDFSPGFAEKKRQLKRFLFENLYRHFKVERMRVKAERYIAMLFDIYVKHPTLLPQKYVKRMDSIGRERVICDYIAGMTDRFALDEFKRLFEPYERV